MKSTNLVQLALNKARRKGGTKVLKNYIGRVLVSFSCEIEGVRVAFYQENGDVVSYTDSTEKLLNQLLSNPKYTRGGDWQKVSRLSSKIVSIRG
jgi:hypothetical protein